MAYVNVRISRHLKEKLALAIDKQLRVSSNKMVFKTVSYATKKLKEKATLLLKQYCMHCYVTFSNIINAYGDAYPLLN